MATNLKMKKTASRIIKDTKNLKLLPPLIKAYKQNTSTTTNGILWLQRIFDHYNEKISFLNQSDTESSANNKAALWMKKQYDIFENILIDSLHCSKTLTTINVSFKCLLHFVKLSKNTNLCEQTLIILLFKSTLSNELKSIFCNFVYDKDSESNDATFCGIKCFAKICHLSSTDLISKYLKLTKTKNKNTNDDTSKRISIFLWNALEILFILSKECNNKNSQKPPLKKRKLSNKASNKQRINYLSIAWLNYLSGNELEIKIYHLILTRLESVIFRVFKQSNFSGCKNNNIILLADFLTDSYNIGGEISLLSLKGLFVLINDYNLDYPNFYQKLYTKLHSNIFFSKNATKFFELLSLFLLKSDYIPQYLVCAFMKRLSRMSLFAPPNAIIFIVNIITDLLRKYPAVRFLVDKSKKTNQGLMDAMKLHKEQKIKMNEEQMDIDEDESECEDEEQMIGNDPFDFECMDPKECGANESSLWELKSLINHFEYKTSGHCFETVTHFQESKFREDRDYKRVPMSKCHMFEYHKLLNYYFQRNFWFLQNMKNEKEREQLAKNGGGGWRGRQVDKEMEKKKRKKRYNVHEISVDRKEHLFPADSIFRDVFSI